MGARMHNRRLEEIPNAIDGRKDINVQVFGMEGIPEEFLEESEEEKAQRLAREAAMDANAEAAYQAYARHAMAATTALHQQDLKANFNAHLAFAATRSQPSSFRLGP